MVPHLPDTCSPKTHFHIPAQRSQHSGDLLFFVSLSGSPLAATKVSATHIHSIEKTLETAEVVLRPAGHHKTKLLMECDYSYMHQHQQTEFLVSLMHFSCNARFNGRDLFPFILGENDGKQRDSKHLKEPEDESPNCTFRHF